MKYQKNKLVLYKITYSIYDKNDDDNKERKGKYLESSGGKLNTYGGFGFQAEFISSKPGKNIGFANTRVPDQHDLKQIVILMIHSMTHFFPLLFFYNNSSNTLSSDLSSLPDPTTKSTSSVVHHIIRQSMNHREQNKTKQKQSDLSIYPERKIRGKKLTL